MVGDGGGEGEVEAEEGGVRQGGHTCISVYLYIYKYA